MSDYVLQKITEKFNRDERMKASKNIAIREFVIDDNEIYLTYHYRPGQFTRAMRMYVKPPLAERGDRLVVNPTMTYGYNVSVLSILLENLSGNDIVIISLTAYGRTRKEFRLTIRVGYATERRGPIYNSN